jgi:putative membrane protein
MEKISSDFVLMGMALAGAIAGCLLALLPGLHVYSFAALALLMAPQQADALAFAFMGALVGWATVNVAPAVFLRTSDDAQAMAVLPATRYMLQGRGAEAAMLIGAGSLCAMLALVIVAPALSEIIRPLRTILQPHLGWMLLAIIVFLLMGEWPRHNDLAGTPLRRLRSAWAYLGAGLLTFGLSGLLGIALFQRNPMPLNSAFQGMMPAFTGLFAVPALLQLLLSKGRPPTQTAFTLSALPPHLLLRGAATGVAGGLFSTLLPVVTGGIGGLLAGHATAQRDERAFMISLGASKSAYYIGSLMLLFLPGVTAARGGMAAMIGSTYVPYGWHNYGLAVAAVGLCGALSFAFLGLTVRLASRHVHRLRVQWVAVAALVIVCGLVALFTGLAGLAVMAVATSIGLIPLVAGGRRLNCLGVLLVPVTLNVIGLGPVIAGWLGLA